MASEKNIGFIERLYFLKLEYDVDLDRKKKTFGVQNIIEKHIGYTRLKVCAFMRGKVNIIEYD